MRAMAVWALGINHTTAPLDLRGRFAFALDQLPPTLDGLRGALARSPEAAILSTCNRTEIYCASEQLEIAPTLQWLARSGGVTAEELRTSLATAKLRWNSWLRVVPRAPASSATRTASFIWPRICGSPSTM